MERDTHALILVLPKYWIVRLHNSNLTRKVLACPWCSALESVGNYLPTIPLNGKTLKLTVSFVIWSNSIASAARPPIDTVSLPLRVTISHGFRDVEQYCTWNKGALYLHVPEWLEQLRGRSKLLKVASKIESFQKDDLIHIQPYVLRQYPRKLNFWKDHIMFASHNSCKVCLEKK
jgi:hypothetical protein